MSYSYNQPIPLRRTNTSQARMVAAAESKNRTSTGVFPYAGIATPQAQLASVTGLASGYGARLAQGYGQGQAKGRRMSRKARKTRKARKSRRARNARR
jgi:hypothetical protein